MPFEVTMDVLNDCDDLEYAVPHLGRDLASYLLKPKYREEVGLDVPILPENAMPALFVLERPALDAWKTLADSFILPFRWIKGKADSKMLPEGLGEFAESVRKMMSIEGWGLDFSENLNRIDLRKISFDFQSMWATLAAGLYLASTNARSRPGVFSTGLWSSSRGVSQIDGLAQKITAMKDFVVGSKAKDEISLFVPENNYSDAVELTQDFGWKVSAYPNGETSPLKALNEHLFAMDAPPPKSASFEEKVRYLNCPYVQSNFNERQKYYLDSAVDSLAKNLRTRMNHPPDKLVLGLSFSYSLLVLLIKAIQPKQVLLMYTPETKPKIKNVEKYLGRTFDQKELLCFEFDKAKDFIRDCVNWLQSDSSAISAVEITGGNKPMSVALIAAAQKSGTGIYYLNHQMDDNNKPKAGTEELVELDWF